MRATVMCGEAHDVGVRELRQPLAVVPHLEELGIVAEDGLRLLEVELRVPVDLLVGEDRPLGRAARRVADARRVVADDEDGRVALVLEGAHSLKRDAATDVDVGRRDVDPELDAQRTPERELLLELSLREDVDGVPGQLCDCPWRTSLEAARQERGAGAAVPPWLLDRARDPDPRSDDERRLILAREKLERRLVERRARRRRA